MARQLISGCVELLKDMAGPMISGVLGQVESVARQMTEEEVKAVKDVGKEVEKLRSEFTAIQAVLEDAEKRQHKEATVRDWLDKLNDVSHDIDDVLDEWITAIKKANAGKEEDHPPTKKVCLSLSSASSWVSNCRLHGLVLRRKIASKIKELNGRLSIIAIEKSRYMFSVASDTEQPKRSKSTSFVDLSNIYGRDTEKKVLISRLCEKSQDDRGLDIIPIIGMGGIGKTTLAQLAYHDDRVKAHFEKRIWVCVSDPFDEIRVARSIIENLGGGSSDDLTGLPSILERIYELIRGKRFLLILDDVWTEDATKWEPLKEALRSGHTESRILVTTRKKEVAKMMRAESKMISVDLLSDEICWSIFSQLAFSGSDRCSQLEEIGKQMVIKCKGLPLVAKSLGSLMRNKTRIQQWDDVLHSELWKLEKYISINNVFGAFLLSYNDLPCVEKRCLSYCSIFPKDYEMGKDDLINLWMSQGYLNGSESLEKEGQDCFENLAMRSFFQDFEKDAIGNIISCKMHDIVHDFVQFLTKNECSIVDVTGKMEEYSGKKLRHATLVPESDTPTPSSLYEIKGLRTLFVAFSGNVHPEVNLESLFSNLTCLRTLNLKGGKFEQLPEGIENLIHLRYLDLSWNYKLKELPNSICDLFNLQTLKLVGCSYLGRLPDEIWKLVSLRHLYTGVCYRLKRLPKGIAKLSSLRTLDDFCVPDYGSLMDNNKTLELEDLNMLKHLQGSLVIRKCGNYENGVQARRAQLKDKQYLVNLKLWFDSSCGNGGPHEEILEALEPHPNLECLGIKFYKGNTISPNWMMSLVNLKLLKLTFCGQCEFLPPLGKLPSLEFLVINYCVKVKTVGVEFLGIENEENGALGRHRIFFPKLKQLEFERLVEWEKWELGINLEEEEEDNCFTIMPSLQSLQIKRCWNLTALPDFLRKIPLQRLLIAWCPILKERCREGVGEDWPKISHIPNTQLQD